MVPDVLSQGADLIISIIIDSDLFPWICSLQEVATDELWLQPKYFVDCSEWVFSILDGLVCCANLKGGLFGFGPEDKKLC